MYVPSGFSTVFDLSEHLEAIFTPLQQIGLTLFIKGENEDNTGLSVEIVDVTGVATTFDVAYPADSKYYPLEIEEEQVYSIEEYLAWIIRQAKYDLPDDLELCYSRNFQGYYLEINEKTVQL